MDKPLKDQHSQQKTLRFQAILSASMIEGLCAGMHLESQHNPLKGIAVHRHDSY